MATTGPVLAANNWGFGNNATQFDFAQALGTAGYNQGATPYAGYADANLGLFGGNGDGLGGAYGNAYGNNGYGLGGYGNAYGNTGYGLGGYGNGYGNNGYGLGGYTFGGSGYGYGGNVNTPHAWTADGTGLFHTNANLEQEWKQNYQIMLAGYGDWLTPIQRQEGNAEAVFENTAIAKQPAEVQAKYREDAQRSFDALAVAMQINATTYGIDPNAPLTATTYRALENTIQSNPLLLELAMQGHGLNNSGVDRYAGYTNDFQNNVDGTTLFVGGGILSNNQNALATFFDDNILSHLPYSSVVIDGKLQVLNQNAAAENQLLDAVVGLNNGMFNRTYLKSDFSATTAVSEDQRKRADAATQADKNAVAALKAQINSPTQGGQLQTIFGSYIPNSIANQFNYFGF